ncbi:hypothetical protein LOK49_LG13G02753 [Camellia lanceoleosa]|uniref:Uncharacterized protein n=1 Tax=Camellia lanceoleosa TaxID=1840588 RepID=A0ACC0FGR5_9ERIC|nr:hypothetical protein LOK49_LG13G02753 [Camellia lanceoleosa]
MCWSTGGSGAGAQVVLMLARHPCTKKKCACVAILLMITLIAHLYFYYYVLHVFTIRHFKVLEVWEVLQQLSWENIPNTGTSTEVQFLKVKGKTVWRNNSVKECPKIGQENDINKEASIAEQQSRKRRKKEVEVWQKDVQRIKEQWSRKGRKKEVEVWQKDVQRIKGDVQALQIQEQEIVGWKNVFSRVRLGKLIVDKIKEVAEVQEKGRFSNDLLIDAFPNCAQFIPTTGSLGEITSARNMEKVWEYLMDDEIRRTSIYGIGGFAKQPSCITSTIDS